MSRNRSRGPESRSAIRIGAGVAVLFAAGLAVGTAVAVHRSQADDAARGAVPERTSPFARAALDEDGRAADDGRTAGSGNAQSVPELSAARRTPTVVAAYRVGPSVVAVRTTRRVQATVFDRAFGRSTVVPGLGSGFAIDDEGTIVTNQHVIRDADEIYVINEAGESFEAELVGSDELTDLAVLRIPPGRVPAAPLGSSSDLFIGEPAVAIGNPSGFALRNTEPTVTSGVISGVGRDIQSQTGEEVLYADMIQTDASINPGNSGGPLANAEGEVIGVNSSIFSRSGGSEGLGFAIPIDRAMKVARELLEHGRVRRPWVGVDVVRDRASSEAVFGRPIVREVYADTPGDSAGLRPGDEIVALNGRRIHHDLDWQVGLVDAGVGSVVDVVYRRGGRELQTRIGITEIPSGSAQRVEVLAGLQLVTVTEQIAAERGLSIEFGALIVSVDERTQRETRLRSGDVIYGINGNEVRSAEQAGELFEYYARSAEGQGWVRVHVTRGTQRGATTFRVG